VDFVQARDPNNLRSGKHITVSKTLKSKLNRRSHLLKKQKHRMQLEQEKDELKALNKYIRNYYDDERRTHVRRNIISGNNKSLWDAVKIARTLNQHLYLQCSVEMESVLTEWQD
jgi:hypothetical protein